MGDIDCEYTGEVVCPYCGYEHSDSHEYGLNYDGDDTEIECDECSKKFNISLCVETSYVSSKKECEELGVEHDFIFRTDHLSSRGLDKEMKFYDKPKEDWEYNEIFKCSNCDEEEYRKISEEEFKEKYPESYRWGLERVNKSDAVYTDQDCEGGEK